MGIVNMVVVRGSKCNFSLYIYIQDFKMCDLKK